MVEALGQQGVKVKRGAPPIADRIVIALRIQTLTSRYFDGRPPRGIQRIPGAAQA
jgi:hypothetical protein